jgi:hypothetical protein
MAKTLTMVFAIAALAAATPGLSTVLKEGPVDTTLCWGGPMHLLSANPTERFGTYVVKGGTSATDQVFDSMILECIGTFEARSAGAQSKGYCVFQDAIGDRIYGVDALTPGGGYTWEYLGGTGKFEGISGSGKIERVGDLGPAAGTLRGCRRFIGSYKMSSVTPPTAPGSPGSR